MSLIILSKLFLGLMGNLGDWKSKVNGETGAWKKRDVEGPFVRL